MRPLLHGFLWLACASAVHSQSPALGTMDYAAPPAENYAVAEFRFWMPQNTAAVRAVLVLVPGSNGDGRAMAEDTVWQQYAARNRLAIVACRFRDKPHEQSFIEEYVQVSRGSGDALLQAIDTLAARTTHPELAHAPVLLWGMSAGGQFDYEFAAWKPERVAAFIVNKGGIYYTALTPRATRQVPALLFLGGKDLESRRSTIAGLFAVNRRGGALWAVAEEPNAAHVVGRSRDLSMIFFEDVLTLRLSAEGTGGLEPATESAGFIGDPHTRTVNRAGAAPLPSYPTAWLPTERVARAWQAVVNDRAIEP